MKWTESASQTTSPLSRMCCDLESKQLVSLKNSSPAKSCTSGKSQGAPEQKSDSIKNWLHLDTQETLTDWLCCDFLCGGQDVRCGWPEVREKEVDPLFRGCDLHHLLRSSQRIRHGAGRGRRSGELRRLCLIVKDVRGQTRSASEWLTPFFSDLFSEPHARVPPSIQQYLQPQILCTDLHRAFPQQKGSLWREDQESPSEYLLPRLWR